jgi:hypothetical protein
MRETGCAVHGWAIDQGLIDIEQARLITVGVSFAGHGVNINRNEHRLLSDAPRRANAAVNVTGSAEFARRCGARYVAFVSDACRSAPEGLQAQNVRGQDIFPNDGVSKRAQPVGQFFACVLGRTGAELAGLAVAAGTLPRRGGRGNHDASVGRYRAAPAAAGRAA